MHDEDGKMDHTHEALSMADPAVNPNQLIVDSEKNSLKNTDQR